jgi:hypothetical protein
MQVDLSILHHQYEFLSSDTYMTSLSCGRGAGKTSSLCIVAIKSMLEGKKVLIVEPIISQFRTVLAPEMNAMLQRMKIVAKFNKSTYTWKYGIGEIICVSAEAAERLRGISEVSVLLLDECGSFDEMVLNLAIPTMRGVTVDNPKVGLFSTATTKSHWFCKRSLDNETKLIYASSADNPFNGPDYYPNLLKQYKGLPEDFIQREIYGKFTDLSHNTIFHDIVPTAIPKRGLKVAGVDLALGGDYTSFVMFDGNVLAVMEKALTPKIENTERFIRQMCATHRPAIVNYDSTGHGSYAEVGKWTGVTTNAVNFGMSAGARYANMRTKIYFDLYFRLKDFYQAVEFAKFKELLEELEATTIDEGEKAKISLIKKDEIKKLIGRSPDYADAAALAAIPMNEINHAAIRTAQIRNNPFGRG